MFKRSWNVLKSISLLATRSHSRREQKLDVYTFTLFGDRIFLPSTVPQARISSTDILAVLTFRAPSEFSRDMIELPAQEWNEFLELNARNQKKCEGLWRGSKARLRLR